MLAQLAVKKIRVQKKSYYMKQNRNILEAVNTKICAIITDKNLLSNQNSKLNYVERKNNLTLYINLYKETKFFYYPI